MKKAFISIKTAVMLAALVGLPVMSYAQSLSESSQEVSLEVSGSAMIALHSSTDGTPSPGVSMTLSGLTVAGAEIVLNATNSNTRLRISSLVGGAEGSQVPRKIEASITESIASSGTKLYVTLIKPNNFEPKESDGVTDYGGSSTGRQELTTGAVKPLVTNIFTCWSGTENNDGYTVEYYYEKDPDATAYKSTSTTVKYTISEDA